MQTRNFTLRASWIEKLAILPDFLRAKYLVAIYNYFVFGITPDDEQIRFGTSFIFDDIDRMKQAQERREAKKAAKEQQAEVPQQAEEPPIAPEPEPSLPDITPSLPENATQPSPEPIKTIANPHPRIKPQNNKQTSRKPEHLNFRDFKRLRAHSG